MSAKGQNKPMAREERQTMLKAICDGNPTGLRDILAITEGTEACYTALTTPTRTMQYPLHIACGKRGRPIDQNRRLAVVRMILEFIPQNKRLECMMLRDLMGYTALHIAAIHGKVALAETLLETLSTNERIELVSMVDMNYRKVLQHDITDEIRSLIQMYVMDAAPSTMKKIKTEFRGEDPTKTEHSRIYTTQLNKPNSLIIANGENVLDHVDSLVDSVGYSQNYNKVIELKNKKGQTLLHRAAMGGRTDIVNKLLSALNSPDEHWKLIRDICNGGKTALHYASSAGCSDIVCLLLQYSGSKDIDLANFIDNGNRKAHRYSKTVAIHQTLTMVETHHWKTFYQRPMVLVFYNRFTEYTKWKRIGADEEKDLIVESFKDLGMASQVHVDFSKKTIFERINDAVEAKKGDISALIIVAMSHGEEGLVYDRNLKTLDVQLIIDNLCNNTILQHTPKVLMVQSCRGKKGKDGLIPDTIPTTQDALVAPSNLGPTAHEPCGRTLQRCRYSIPCDDMMVVMSTLHGQTSYRARLAAMFKRITGDPQCPSDILDMFVRINGAMACDQTIDANHTFKRKLLLKNPLDDPPSVLTRIKFLLN